ncbi:MAG: extracellular solute-binding protein [Candidatus Uhrbacteria bacterium]|nr:extracellular solute-binding protein [Candidatus Uhrbacteria bacterium]
MKMRSSVLLFLCFSVFIFFGAGCTKGLSPEVLKASERADINVWGVIDDVDAYQAVLEDYRKLHPHLTFNYRRLRLEEYENALLEALAEDRGPDIFLIHNDWTGKYLSKISPQPPSTKIAYQVVVGTIKKEQTWELRTEQGITNKSFKDQYADVAIKDIMRTVNVSPTADKQDFQQRILGIPVSIDTLALYYNKDLLNAAGLPTPPETWSQFQEQVKKLTKLDAQGNLLQSGAGFGTAFNVERAVDLVSVLMMQNGTEMADEIGRPTFELIPAALADRELPPAFQALQFYTDFANPAKETFTWNNAQPNSLDAFIQGRTAFFFGYSYHLNQIRARAPKLNLGVSALPQIDGNPVRNYANYWYFVVSKKTKNPDIAWNFLNFLAKPEESKKILEVIKRPAARKKLLQDQFNDEQVGVFASQVLTSVSWYRGKDPKAAEDAILNMIQSIINGTASVSDAIRFAVDKINQTIQ